MSTAKIAITLEEKLLKDLDLLVKEKVFPNRSNAIQEAVREKLNKLNKMRLATECSKLDPGYEQSLAEEGFNEELETWPEY